MSTLGLNIIVGNGESKILERCLRSFDVKNNFDEIVIINTSLDDDINSLAKQFTNKIFYFQWETEDHPHGSFSSARNFAIEKSTTDKIMWLDTDDYCLDKYKEKLKDIIKLIKDEQYNDVMIWTVPYALITNENGEPELWFKRERIFDRKKISWKRSIHEILFPYVEMVKTANINGFYVTHLPTKPTYVSALRNIKMLEHEYNIDKTDVQTKYFLGRDYLYTGEFQKGINLLDEILQDLDVSYEMLYAIALELTWFYSYNGITQRPQLETINKDNLLKIEGYCRLALSFTHAFPEIYVLLGDVYYHKEEYDLAIKMYITAMKKKIGTGKINTPTMYGEIPAERISYIFTRKQSFGMAIHYISIALKLNKSLVYLERKKRLITELQMEVTNEQC